jgi:hypothetical protein
MKSASLRLGGIKKSYDDHLLIIGDAAGFIDPLTGGTQLFFALFLFDFEFFYNNTTLCFHSNLLRRKKN